MLLLYLLMSFSALFDSSVHGVRAQSGWSYTTFKDQCSSSEPEVGGNQGNSRHDIVFWLFQAYTPYK